MRDSAGIRIVEHQAEALTQLPVWRVSTEPPVTIGASGDAAEGPEEVVGAYLGADGAIVYADAAALEVRIHAPDGTRVRALGRRGSGPGEFANITSIWQRRDSSAVYDMSAKRLTVAPHDGSPARIAVLRHSGLLTSVQGSADGRLIARQLDVGALTRVGSATVRVPEHVIVISADGSSTDTILTVPGPSLYQPAESPGWTGPAPVGLGPESEILVTGNSVVIGTNDSFGLTTYDLAGTPVGIVRIAAAAPRVEGRLIDLARQAAWEDFAARAGDMPQEIVSQYRSFLDGQRYADRLPFHGALASDAAGNLWVQDYAAPGDAEERFTIVGSDGSLVARAILPPGLHLLAAGEAEVLGLWHDADGVAQIRLHALTR